MIEDRIGTDTNVLLRFIQPDNPHHERAVRALSERTLAGDEFVVVPQNLVEFWTVAPRPLGDNGLGMTPRETKEHVEDILRAFTFLPDTVGSFARWFDLVDRYEVKGKTTHDARLVATLLDNGVRRLLAFNARDLKRHEAIRAESPSAG